MMRCTLICILLASAYGANPIRKVVNLMQNMQKEIEADGAKEKTLFDKFMCYCSGGAGDLNKAIADSTAQIEQLTSKLNADSASKAQTAQDLNGHKNDREGATKDLEAATVLRNKESAAFAALKGDMDSNIAAMGKAIPALESGMGGAALLQVPGVSGLRKIIDSYSKMDSMDRRTAVAFLEGSTDYAPQSGQIVGILKSMKDDMEADLKEAMADEARAVAGFNDIKASKSTEIEMATEAIEAKLVRAGSLAVSVTETTDALADEKDELASTQAFAAKLASECGTKEKEWAERSQTRAQEISAISDAIGIMNDDDALDLFKKALPSSFVQHAVGFLQEKNTKASRLHKAQAMLAGLKSKSMNMQLLLFTLGAKLKTKSAGGFDDIVQMVDAMITLLGQQQAEDAKQRAWCEGELEKSANEKAATQTKIGQTDATLGEQNDALSTLMEEINALTAKIAALDKSSADATVMRQEEHQDYVDQMQMNEAAIGLVKKAQNRLNKFYNPVLYKAAPKTEMTMEEKIQSAGSFVQIRRRSAVAPGAAPATFEGGYEKKGEKSAGVLSMLDTIIKDLENDSKDAGFAEKTGQADYAQLMADSQATRAADAKALTSKGSAKAATEDSLIASKESRGAAVTDLRLVNTAIKDLHASCDFILQNGDLRAEARTNEIEGLKNAKAVLSGAGYSF